MIRFACTLLLTIYSTVLNAIGLKYLWSWFVVNQFNLPALSGTEAAGLALLITYLTYHPSLSEDERSLGETLLIGFIYINLKVVFSLLIGAFIHGIM